MIRLDSSLRFLDLEATETHSALRSPLAKIWRDELHLPDLDVAAIRSHHGPLTRAIGRWAYEHGLAGLRYLSRINTNWECWAIFDRTPFAVQRTSLIRPDDPEFVAASQALGLTVE